MAKTVTVAPPAAPRISVIERRLKGDSAFRSASVAVPLIDASWVVRWENSAIAPDHLYRILHELGWQYAEPADLACSVEEIGAHEREGKIVRGERGAEVLVKMRARDYARVQAMKDAEVRKHTFGDTAIKQAVIAGVGAEYGDQGATFVSQHLKNITVTDSRGAEE